VREPSPEEAVEENRNNDTCFGVALESSPEETEEENRDNKCFGVALEPCERLRIGEWSTLMGEDDREGSAKAWCRLGVAVRSMKSGLSEAGFRLSEG
jgi:hypothetical protein